MNIFVENPVLVDLQSFLKNGFSSAFQVMSNTYQFVKTYKDNECKELECKPARRSFDNLVIISRTYFPEATESDIIKALVKIEKIRCFYCNDIRKPVFYIAGQNHDIFSNDCLYDKGKSNYTIEMLKALANS